MKEASTKKVFLMSFPIFIELFLQLLVGNIDQVMISHYSQNSVAAIANGNQIINIVIIVLNVMCVATTILVSQYFGAENQRKITEVCNVSLLVLFIASIAMSFFMIFGSQVIFTWMKVPENILKEAGQYLAIIGLFILVQGLYMNFAAILRSFGYMKEVMCIAAIMNVVNIGGNALLINGLFGLPRLGIIGAAISTNISKTIGLLLIFWMFKHYLSISLSRKYLKPFPFDTLKQLLHIGIPSGGEEISYALSQICILKFINLFGTAVIATKAYCSLLANIAYVYSMALAQATQIMVSYLVGANDPEHIRKQVWTTLFISMAISLSITGILYLNSDSIFRIFTDDAAILSLGKKILFIELFLEIGRNTNIVMTKCLIAIGDVFFPVSTGIIFMWSVAVVCGYIFGVALGYGLVGIWIVMAADECLRGIVFIIRFRSGRWRKSMAAAQACHA